MESIWKDELLPPFPKLQEHIQTDVLVIGGGMAGLLCGHFLKQAGIDCVIVEAARIGSGTTGNTTAKITSQHGLLYHKLISRFGPEAAELYLQANEDALDRYRTLCKTISCDFEEQDNYIYSLSNRQILEEELAAVETLGFPAEFAADLPLPFAAAGAVRFPHQAQFHPLKFLSAIAAELNIRENTFVRELEKNTAVTDCGSITAECIIVATHFPFLNKHGSYYLKLFQQRSYCLELENASISDGMYLDQGKNGISLRTHGDRLILGGGGHRTGKQGGGWSALEAFSRTHYPDARIIRRWAAQDCMTLDGMPYIGQYSARTPNLYVATGFNKWGMTSSMAAAQILTDRILGKEKSYAHLFDPSRSMLHPQLALNLLESTKNLLTPTGPRCPHLGCALKWNPQEHSWDCPCHGSRFAEDGQLIDNPATGDLKKRE